MERGTNNPWATHMPAHTQDNSNSIPPTAQLANMEDSYVSADMPPPYSEVPESTPTSRRPIDSKHDYYNADQSSSHDNSSRHLSRSSSSSSGEDDILAQALEFTHHTPPPYARTGHLQRPVAIPQVASGLSMPFSRGYATALHDRGVFMEEFVEFIDNLNIVSSSSPPLQVLDAVSGIVGMIPLQTAQIVGGSLQAAAKLGNVALSKTRGAMFLRKANSEFFNPRGLKMELVTGDALRVRLGMNQESPLAFPLEQSGDMSLHERRIAALQGYISPVTFDVPPPNEPTNVLNRISAGAQHRNIAKQEKMAFEARGKYAEESAKAQKDISKEMAKAERDLDKIENKIQREMEKRDRELSKIQSKAERELHRKPKDAHKIERERERDTRRAEHEFERETKRLAKDQEKVTREFEREERKSYKDVKKEDKEGKTANKIQWILIEDL